MKSTGFQPSDTQLAQSVDKLFHYLFAYSLSVTRVTVMLGPSHVLTKEYQPASEIYISESLYTRIDDCHGAGNCCLIPYDLVYTDYCRSRIVDYDYAKAANEFGERSADVFLRNRDNLLENMVEMDCKISDAFGVVNTKLWALRNLKLSPYSNVRSCQYLTVGDDRYYCGAHAFKPLHCWFPHMTVRAIKHGDRNSISIGRMQYGRNHKFGCPVLFTPTIGKDGHKYFATQYDSDLGKLNWTSKAISAIGLNSDKNFGVGIDAKFSSIRPLIEQNIQTGCVNPITLYQKGQSQGLF